MKRFIEKYRLLIMTACILFAVSIAMAQDGTVAPSASLGLLFIPYILGILAHWFKKYQLDGVTVNFWSWLFKDFGNTVISWITGVSLLIAQIQMNPGAYSGTGLLATIGIWISVFMTAVGADTLNNTKPPQP